MGLDEVDDRAFALAGVAIGLGLCFYSAFQLFVAILGLAWVYAYREGILEWK